MIAEAMRLVLERHLEGAAIPDLALWSLRGLGVLDPRFDVVQHDGQLRVTVEDKPLAAFPLARLAAAATPEAAGTALGELLAETYEAAWRVSPVLRRAGADRVIASGFDEVFNHLDPYSRYVTAAEARISRERRVGQSGLGLRIAVRGNGLRVVAVTQGGPAAEEGVRVGDRLLAVDGRRLSAAEPERAAALLEGPEGSAVTLTLARGTRRFGVTLVRELVVPETVSVERRDDILWISVSGFSSQTEDRIIATLVEGFDDRPPRGVVLDLRGNRGGLLTQAVAVADAFLTSGEVARTEGRHPDAARRYVAGGRDLAQGRPVVVLVDGRTASAAEIVAMALAARHRAVIVGSATTGKGLIQLVAPLANEAELLITWSQVVSPSGWPVQGLGVLPELCTSLGPEALAAGLAELAAGRPPMAAALARQRAARPPVLPSEVVALRGACPPAEGRPADLAAARALIDSPRAYETALRSLPQ
ncbi:peptidase S41 [Falsiroseomonas bella]|uniref:Peptidase S41 n=1 Tax=Falsiroseomonas bella TaxID=2184016 RepID=A0A317FBM2_9PROT|nr:S41 family peptidase [Falsiroseomonas bella]PWS36501.1 peptidase S41 [Falsiroseomonas bella]